MKILNVSYDDYANLMHGHTKALKSVGVDVMEAKLKPHQFGYRTQAPVLAPSEIMRLMRWADIINVYHSAKPIANLIEAASLRGKVINVWHTGSEYRAEPEKVRNNFEQIGVKRHFTDQCEFLIHDSTLTYASAAIDVNEVLETVNPSGYEPLMASKLWFSHFPSKPEVKGSPDIRRMMAAYGDKLHFEYSDGLTGHDQNLIRMFKCDVYIELFKAELNGKPYGCHGVTAFEAAAMGKIVLTQNIYRDAYEKVYGYSPLFLAHTESEFTGTIDYLISLSQEQIKRIKLDHYDWMLRKHDINPIGNQLKKYYSEL